MNPELVKEGSLYRIFNGPCVDHGIEYSATDPTGAKIFPPGTIIRADSEKSSSIKISSLNKERTGVISSCFLESL
jgi:hypothetical protein